MHCATDNTSDGGGETSQARNAIHEECREWEKRSRGANKKEETKMSEIEEKTQADMANYLRVARLQLLESVQGLLGIRLLPHADDCVQD